MKSSCMNLTDWSVSAYLETLPPALDVSSLHPVTFSPPDLSRNDDVIQVIMLNNSAQPGISISNLTSPVEETCRFRPTTENYLVVVAFIAIFLLSVIGNALVIVVIMQQRAMRSITNIYLMNLAITDLMLSVVCMPPTLVSMVMNCWLFGNMMCKLFAYLQPMVVTASAYTLAVIAFERYFAICKPLHSRIWQTRSHAYAMISLVWLIALVANVLMLFMYEEQTYNLNGLTCTPIHAPVYHFANQVYMTIVLLAIPLVVMTVLYGSVIRTLKMGIRLEIAAVENSIDNDNSTEEVDAVSRKPSVLEKLSAKLTLGAKNTVAKPKSSTIHRRSESSVLDHSLRSTHNQKSAIAKQRVIKMLIVVVIIFFCCWTPSYIWWLLLMAGDSFESLQLSVWNSDLNTFITLLTYLSSCTNPITYCFLNKKFRNAIYATFGRKKVLRHHFQKVYFPVNVHSPQLPNNNEKHHINRSASSNCNRPHQVGSEWKMTRSISSTTSNPLNISTNYSLVRQNGISPSKSRGNESMI